MIFQPFRELFRRQDPDTGPILFSTVTALKRRAKGSRIVCKEGCLQYILTVLQFQIVVVGKTATAAYIIDVLIHQHAGTELRMVMLREGPADGIPQQSGKKPGAVSIIPPGHHSRKGGCQPALRGNLYNCGLAVVRKRISRNGLHSLQNSGSILPELDGCIFCRPDSIQ